MNKSDIFFTYGDKLKYYKCNQCNKIFYYAKVPYIHFHTKARCFTKDIILFNRSNNCTYRIGGPLGWVIDYIPKNRYYACGYGSKHDTNVYAIPNKYSGMCCLRCIDSIIDNGECDRLH